MIGLIARQAGQSTIVSKQCAKFKMPLTFSYLRHQTAYILKQGV